MSSCYAWGPSRMAYSVKGCIPCPQVRQHHMQEILYLNCINGRGASPKVATDQDKEEAFTTLKAWLRSVLHRGRNCPCLKLANDESSRYMTQYRIRSRWCQWYLYVLYVCVAMCVWWKCRRPLLCNVLPLWHTFNTGCSNDSAEGAAGRENLYKASSIK